jgi:hypothetical protein
MYLVKSSKKSVKCHKLLFSFLLTAGITVGIISFNSLAGNPGSRRKTQGCLFIVGGGESGAATRIPEQKTGMMTVTGVTGVICCPGTDGITHPGESVLMKMKSIRDKGLSPWMVTGAQPDCQHLSPEGYFPFLKWLASPVLEGRETGTQGEAKAADSIAVEMRRAGLAPWYRAAVSMKDSLSAYFQPVTICLKADSLGEKISLNNHRAGDTIFCRNVIGILPGWDTSQIVVIGAHYDHLGKKGEVFYPGADDNASGVAGLLTLASAWTKRAEKPSSTIVFASWTAEEIGHFGSRHFVNSLTDKGKVKLYINLDMISRSEKIDTACRMLSIGTRIRDGFLREMAQKCNAGMETPFILDLWDVTGAHGSDYASFTIAGIPILTFNTGLHDDYHTPRDLPEAVDLKKMGRVLELIDRIIEKLE